jgi:hypothetical protein
MRPLGRGREDVDCFYVGQDTGRLRDLVQKVMKFGVSHNTANLSTE